MSSIEERFLAKVSKQPSGCWLWTAFKNPSGYGMFRVQSNVRLAHRVSYELFNVPIPDGLVLDHLCRVRNCVNPDHLRVCSRAENNLAPGSLSTAKKNSDATHCPRGHRLGASNSRSDSRSCKACHQARSIYFTLSKYGTPDRSFQEIADEKYSSLQGGV